MVYSTPLKRSLGVTENPLPLYFQITSLMRDEILGGTWPSGSQLPTELNLSRRYGVSRPTIRKAKKLLTQEGFINNIKGSGCYVNDQQAWKVSPPTVENLNDIFHFGTTMPFIIKEFGMVSNTQDIKSNLKNPDDRFVFQIKGIRYHQNQPLAYVTYHLPFRLGSRIPMETLDENPFIPQFERLAGIEVVEGIQSISIGRADRAVSNYLDLKRGDPLLLIESVYFDDAHRPVEYVRSLCRDKLPYSIRVRRN